ncbi:MAG: hypothetical protein ACK5PR_03010 [bacterium]
MEKQVHGPRARLADRTGSSILNYPITNWNLVGPNFVNRLTTDSEVDILFGNEDVTELDTDCLSWPDIALRAGFFPSKTQAIKNGWEGAVPWGFGQRKFGNKGKGVWFYNAPPPSPSP